MLHACRKPVLAAAIWLGAAPCGWAATWEPHFLFATGEGRAAVQDIRDRAGVTAVSLALVDGDTFGWTEAFGFKAISGERLLAASEETLFGLGPVSRLVTAIAVLNLVERGELRLDDPVVRHLPAFRMVSPEFRQITIRMLLSGASGLPGTDRRNRYTSVPFPGYPKQVLAALAHQRLKHPPGLLHSTGDDAYTLLEAVVARVTRGSFTQYVQKAILDPLGMANTRFAVAALPQQDCALNYRGPLPLPLPLEYSNACGAAGLYTTPADMARLITMLVNGGALKGEQILDEASIQEMGRDQTGDSFNPLPSPLATPGLGWDTVDHPALKAAGRRAWAIQGESPHYGSAILVVPAERMGIIVLGTAGFTGAAAASVAERIVLRKLVENRSITEMPKAGEALALAEARELEEPLERVRGIYASRAAAYRVSPGTFLNTLTLERYRPGDRAWAAVAKDLRPRVDGWFASDGEPENGYRFLTAGPRKYLARRWTTRFCGLQEVMAERVASQAKLAPRWRTLAGRTWVLANERPASMFPEPERHLELLVLPGTDNLLFVKGHGFYPVDGSRNGTLAPVRLQLPGPAGGDLEDLAQVPVQGELWLRSGSRLFRPLVPMPAPVYPADPAGDADRDGPWIPE
jgi:CubicO group peptidase (beta-lactamase class C family)